MVEHVEVMLKTFNKIKDFNNKILLVLTCKGPIRIVGIKLLVDLKTCSSNIILILILI